MALQKNKSNRSSVSNLFEGGGEMGKLISQYDWNDHPLNKITEWPQSLLSAASICLNSNFPIAIYWGKDLSLIYNDAWSPIPGSKHPWALGKPAREVWPDIWKEIEPAFETTMNTGKATGSKDALLPMNRHGYVEECYFDFTFTPIYGEQGKVVGVFNAVIETTYRVISERRSKVIKRISSALNSVANAEAVLSTLAKELTLAELDIPFVSYYENIESKWSPIFHINVNEVISDFYVKNVGSEWYRIQGIDEVNKLEVRSPWPEKVKEACYLPVRINGRLVGGLIFGISGRRAFDDDYLKFFQEITNLLEGELQTREALIEQKKRVDELEKLDKAKTIFFSNISHEFRTPITLMLGPLEEAMSRSETWNDPQLKQNLELSYKNTLRLLKLVNGLLDFSRIESGRQKASFVLEDIVQFTKQLASNFQSVVEKAGLKFVIKADVFIQPVYIDRIMWERVVFNLLSNAFKFTLSGSITVSLSAAEKHAVLKVTDTGVGIPKEEIPNLFQRFYRVNNTQSRTIEGTGIGLSMIKELVRQLGGEILVESELGKGTTFEVRLPFGKSHIPVDQFKEDADENDYLITTSFLEEAKGFLGEEEVQKKEVAESKNKDYILIVDDNSDMRQHLKSLLVKTYTVETAANGLDALHKIKEKKPALVLSDIMMPILNGVDLLREIKSNPVTKSIPVILLTARAGEESKIEGFEMGADDYLIKPFASSELISRIRTQLKVSALKRIAERHIYDVFNQAPVAIATFTGKDLVCEFANDHYMEIVKKDKGKFVGKPLFESLPETKDVLYPIAMNLLKTGEPFPAKEFEIVLNRNGRDEICYFNSIWTPLRDEEGSITGMIVCAHEVTEMVMKRKS